MCQKEVKHMKKITFSDLMSFGAFLLQLLTLVFLISH